MTSISIATQLMNSDMMYIRKRNMYNLKVIVLAVSLLKIETIIKWTIKYSNEDDKNIQGFSWYQTFIIVVISGSDDIDLFWINLCNWKEEARNESQWNFLRLLYW